MTKNKLSFPFLLLLQLLEFQSQITFQSGSSNGFYYVGNNLNLYNSNDVGRTHTEQISFSTPFTRTPHVYIVITLHDYDKNYPVGYELETQSITTFGFNIIVTIQHQNKYYGIKLDWYAFDDERRIVINSFNNYNPQQSYSFDHSNPNFAQAVSSLVSFQSKGALLVRTQVDSITSTQVIVKITSNVDLTQVGFQILIGTKEAMIVWPSIECGKFGTTTAVSIPNDWTGKQYVANIEGMDWKNDNNLRVNTSIVNLGSSLIINFGPWSDSQFNSLYLNYFYMLNQWNPGTYLPMLSYDYFQSKIADNKNLIITKASLLEISKTVNSDSTEEILLENSTLDITFEIFAKCSSSELWTLKILQCLNSYQTFNIQCNPNQKFNSHRHIVKFRQTQTVLQNITMIVQAQQIQIVQHIIDYRSQDYIILELKSN